jgi:hypothetical protein
MKNGVAAKLDRITPHSPVADHVVCRSRTSSRMHIRSSTVRCVAPLKQTRHPNRARPGVGPGHTRQIVPASERDRGRSA